MLRAVPHHVFSWAFTVYDGEASVAEIDMSWFREKGEVLVGDVPCRVFREGLVRGAFVLEAGGHVLVRAVKPSAFSRTLEITYDEHHYTLKPRAILLRTFELHRAGEVVGTVAPEHALTRKARVELSEHLPLVVRVFILWLVLLLWKRAADAAASG